MNTEDTKAIAAFVKAQASFGAALKTASNPHFKSRYADLSACVEAVIDGLHANGLALIQTSHPSDTGVAVETILVHESGGKISGGILHVPASKQDAQGYGSALTYARRYGILTLCGIAPEDDDGNAASKPATYKAPARPAPRLTDEISEPINRSTKPKSNGKAPVATVVGAEAEEENLPWD